MDKKQNGAQSTQEEAEWRQRMDDLLAEKTAAPNKFAEYILQRMRDIRIERDMIMQKLRQVEQTADQLDKSRIALEGRFSGYVDDLRRWDMRNDELFPRERESA